MTHLPTELLLLGWSTVLLFAYVMIQGQTATRDRGLDWNAGPRDGEQKPLGEMAGRAERALKNFQETYPVFIALALGLAVTDRTGGMGAIGAWLWFGARIAYIPLYLFGIKYVRSLSWTVSILGLLLMLIRFL
ncbi:putative MAPEG superfamily protein [Sphingomonas sp. PP-CE-1A-559]|uniref:MAPEG family protein n=1 Tax=Sphingomonas sp. PP-CE-1A-559 TaxID=2135657 RepID=UPI001054BE6E|nr:MAPEG family protein [Sphingomonas sp. PP-CE-1A-559]TCP90024.1 putative MAPEG superfamily protein [Sphingomonas sp. PP-CE-1A-559]